MIAPNADSTMDPMKINQKRLVKADTEAKSGQAAPKEVLTKPCPSRLKLDTGLRKTAYTSA